jgi:hypothetical protein
MRAFRLGATPVPCHHAGYGPVRDEALAAAERAGMPVGRWLERAVRKALEEGLEPTPPAGGDR